MLMVDCRSAIVSIYLKTDHNCPERRGIFTEVLDSFGTGCHKNRYGPSLCVCCNSQHYQNDAECTGNNCV